MINDYEWLSVTLGDLTSNEPSSVRTALAAALDIDVDSLWTTEIRSLYAHQYLVMCRMLQRDLDDPRKAVS